jgi:glutamine amidotransferase
MCRILAYLGEPLPAQNLLFDTDNSLVRQSYSPRMMNTFLNLAGFGMKHGTRRHSGPEDPFSYRATTLPSFDRNLASSRPSSRRRVLVAHVRGVTYSGEAVVADTNLHPFHLRGGPRRPSRTTGTCAVPPHAYALLEHVRPELRAAHPGDH